MKLFRGCLKGLVLSVALGLGVLGSPSASLADSAPNPYADKIVVEGATRGDGDTIRTYFNGVDQVAVNRAVADLSATGMFDKVSAKIVGDHVVVSVVEGNLVVNRVAFEGGNKMRSDQLELEVQSKSHAMFNETTAKGDVERIKGAYKKVGRDAAKVTYRLVNLPNGRVDLVFTIDEGDKTGVKEIRFVGNNAISNYRLKNLMQLSEMNLLSWIKTSDVYNPAVLAQDEESIRKYYMHNGYADFHIVNTETNYVPGEAGYTIVITVDEGPQYHVSGVSVTSHVAKVDSTELASDVKLQAGDVYDATAVDKSVEALTRHLARYGYAFADVRPHGQRDNAKHEIALAFTIDESPRVYIERIDITGNTRTRDYVIRREFDIGEGDPYNHTLIEVAERRLNNLGFFKTVHISSRPGSTADRVVVTVEVEDKPTGSISLSGGYSTIAGPIAEVAYTESNFLGRGQYLKLSVSDGQYSNGWSVAFTEPYFLDQHLAAGIDVFDKNQNVNPYAMYSTSTLGFNLRLGVPITNELTFQPNYSLYQSTISIPDTTSQPYGDCGGYGVSSGNTWYNANTPAWENWSTETTTNNCLTNGEASIAIKQAAAQGAQTTSLVGYSLLYNSLDNRKEPTKGIYANFHQDIAGLGGNSDFVRETFDSRGYYPLTDDLVGMLRLQGGQISGYGSQSGQVSMLNNFNLGPQLVRGFAPGGFGPRDISDPNNIATNSLGGTTYLGGSAELQFPLFGTPKELGLKGALFADAGTLYGYQGPTNFSNLLGYSYCPTTVGNVTTYPTIGGNTSTPVTQPSCLQVNDDRTIRASLGVSLLWASPLGPLRFDFAFPIKQGRYDQTQVFNFSGGASF